MCKAPELARLTLVKELQDLLPCCIIGIHHLFLGETEGRTAGAVREELLRV